MTAAVSSTLADLGISGKIFCLSMQRSGTTSVGDFLAQWGLHRVGYPASRDGSWTRRWHLGDFESIFADPAFIEGEVFEDDPWWLPDFYRQLFHRFPGSRFILLSRDPDDWFASMIRHSGGHNPGHTDIHARIYRREDELDWLSRHVEGFDPRKTNLLSIFDKPDHYKAVYRRHTREVEAFFAAQAPQALFRGDLTDPAVWTVLRDWLGLPARADLALQAHAHRAASARLRRAQLPRRVRKA